MRDTIAGCSAANSRSLPRDGLKDIFYIGSMQRTAKDWCLEPRRVLGSCMSKALCTGWTDCKDVFGLVPPDDYANTLKSVEAANKAFLAYHHEQDLITC